MGKDDFYRALEEKPTDQVVEEETTAEAGLETAEEGSAESPTTEGDMESQEVDNALSSGELDALKEQLAAIKARMDEGVTLDVTALRSEIEEAIGPLKEEAGQLQGLIEPLHNRISELEEQLRQAEENRVASEQLAEEQPQEEEWPMGISRKGIRFW